MRQWLSACLGQFNYISVPVSGEEGATFQFFFHLLSLEKKHAVIKTFETQDDITQEEVLHEVLAQPLEMWRQPLQGQSLGDAAEVFVYSDPSVVDVLSI